MIRVITAVALGCACGMSEPLPPTPVPSDLAPVALVPAAVATAAAPAPWTFAVMSDLHMPRRNLQVVDEVPRAVAAIIALRPRFVVVTGDHTNGADNDPPAIVAASAKWWAIFADQLRPLRAAGIPVLPVAGNHDAYLEGQRAHYAAAFADLAAWAAPLTLNEAPGPSARGTGTPASTDPPASRPGAVPAAGALRLDRPPFSYSVDVDGVHLSLAHIVTQALHREVGEWLAGDLATASSAKLRLVFGHVPMASVIKSPNASFVRSFGALLEAGRAALYIAGHEHLVWDEDVALPGGSMLRQVLVGCTSGFYNWSPSLEARRRANCTPDQAGFMYPLRCKMPNGQGTFLLAPNAENQQRVIQHYRSSFTLFTVDGDRITEVRPMTVDGEGHAQPFYLQ